MHMLDLVRLWYFQQLLIIFRIGFKKQTKSAALDFVNYLKQFNYFFSYHHSRVMIRNPQLIDFLKDLGMKKYWSCPLVTYRHTYFCNLN